MIFFFFFFFFLVFLYYFLGGGLFFFGRDGRVLSVCCCFKWKRGLVGLCFPVYGSYLYVVTVLVVQLGSYLDACGVTQVINTAAPAIRVKLHPMSSTHVAPPM